MNGYKVVLRKDKPGRHVIRMSWGTNHMRLGKCAVVYVPNREVTSKWGCGPLCVFDTLPTAQLFWRNECKPRSGKYEIWSCAFVRAGGGFVTELPSASLGIEEGVWVLCGSTIKARLLANLPDGTFLAHNVTLKKRVG